MMGPCCWKPIPLSASHITGIDLPTVASSCISLRSHRLAMLVLEHVLVNLKADENRLAFECGFL